MLNEQDIAARLSALEGWTREGKHIAKVFNFANYHETLAFVNASAWISHRTDHHPDLEVGYNRCRVSYSTHSAGGLTEKDFACAAKIDALFSL
jgi:4a-hydroxytetrahydrobiopterin dehydratase